MDDRSVPDEELGNDLRRDIFLELLEGESLTPSEIGEELDESREQVYYHLDILVRMGLVVPEDGSYRCQELFVSPEYQEAVSAILGTLTPLAEDRIEVSEELEEGQDETVVRNCLRLSVAMNVR